MGHFILMLLLQAVFQHTHGSKVENASQGECTSKNKGVPSAPTASYSHSSETSDGSDAQSQLV